ncbi:hypothetical protein E2C01_021581 [Portunus trituberculatus]|uniref:Uncharacterized protein n=1 Tax=Portunus trituberculatus TaxID=210409 RepID=A0A5B7E3P0_PORTR|nr:hypothetical protein [Portunus trituberculatus]
MAGVQGGEGRRPHTSSNTPFQESAGSAASESMAARNIFRKKQLGHHVLTDRQGGLPPSPPQNRHWTREVNFRTSRSEEATLTWPKG